MAAVLAVLMVCAWKQTAYWQNSETLWTRTLACTKDNDSAHFNFGDALLQRDRFDEAAAQYQKGLQINSRDALTHNDLAIALLQMGRVDEAIAHFKKSLEINSNNAVANYNLAKALSRKCRFEEAITHYQAALQIEPADVEVQNELAWLLVTCPQASLRNGQKALQLAWQINEPAGGKNPVFPGTLAAACAEAGRFGDAVQSAQQALELARAAGQQDLVARLNDELKRYAAGLPLHQ